MYFDLRCNLHGVVDSLFVLDQVVELARIHGALMVATGPVAFIGDRGLLLTVIVPLSSVQVNRKSLDILKESLDSLAVKCLLFRRQGTSL